MLPHPLTNFELQKYYHNEPEFNRVYSRNDFPKVKDGACVINLDEYKSIWTHLIALYANDNNLTYLGVEHIPKEIKRFIGNKNITINIESIRFDNVQINLYWIYWFHVKS